MNHKFYVKYSTEILMEIFFSQWLPGRNATAAEYEFNLIMGVILYNYYIKRAISTESIAGEP